MAAKKKLSAKVRQAVAKAKPKKTFFIIQMPEDQDEAPHWLFWMLLIVFVALLVSIVWQGLALSSSVQAYLPYL
ncbi:TPA: hypothetical protein DHW58_01040 [Patescibacteria group bacterium]|uniref:Uncharacterized protein n=2 Tax=Bacteria division Kazan-3B-28 TaxID=1798534 RepID=A0A0G2A4M2_UNCK3|nr:MAG: hypothetical protein VE98_C0001G0512 [candidate division Kazan bacterium GW2011_GWA1_50_15]KKW25801.1 MAG: hypothetical protein VE99_C0001G0440 [candidate division Kazan bacterium GW2011_GWC1_52_13]KKW27184.1 MAG: hypothetical protein VF00_C0001G0119 [candidate division Kazan bacterium GW2011_GWB1_52_7]HCL47556.1 hypothetical protein [Patescibacteria group bacterium]HCR42474.1 hypothetical protein [Patescibacteria group bacterium]